MDGVLGHDSELTLGRGQTGLNMMNGVMNHAPGAGSIARHDDQQSSALPVCYGRMEICVIVLL